MAKWIKKGLLFQPNTSLWWSKSFAGIPTPELLDESTIRLYYYSMDGNSDGRISYIDVDAQNPSNIKYVHPEPIIDIGAPGSFDDCGVCTGFLNWIDGKRHMYYIGVQRAVKVPYLYFAGLAIEQEPGVWKKYKKTPLLERTDQETSIRSATTIVKVQNEYRMWYVGAYEWIVVHNRQVPKYVIRQAVSKDGYQWETLDQIAISMQNDDEYGFGRPYAIFEEGVFKMWYSIRTISKNYRIGYAESENGIDWIRKDNEVGIDVSQDGWDSQMICYPAIIKANTKTFLFYNGNGHGASGFGYAQLEKH